MHCIASISKLERGAATGPEKDYPDFSLPRHYYYPLKVRAHETSDAPYQ